MVNQQLRHLRGHSLSPGSSLPPPNVRSALSRPCTASTELSTRSLPSHAVALAQASPSLPPSLSLTLSLSLSLSLHILSITSKAPVERLPSIPPLRLSDTFDPSTPSSCTRTRSRIDQTSSLLTRRPDPTWALASAAAARTRVATPCSPCAAAAPPPCLLCSLQPPPRLRPC